ncbi:SDH family Clp fold serine proteinase [Cribrihabitans neustonicus]|uniref:SDH family Clp fold serine proteinase n=1 Tax=Cribrihabitans neustonicus TaxID=1429085 RepID=UPI003B58F78E
MDITTSNLYIEHELDQRLKQLASAMESDVITIVSPMAPGIDDIVRGYVEDIADTQEERQDDLSVILETNGGSIEVVERIANVLRHHYPTGEINFIVPNRAMSAGTVLVMCGDKIFMDYYSILGPVDPQVQSQTSGYFVPALGYLNKYEELIAKSQEGSLSAAEMAFMIEKFDPAELDSFEKARDLSTALLVDWLTQYKFKDWTHTETRGIPVTEQMKADRAKEIGTKLNSTERWKTHSRGISMAVLQRDLNLVVEDYGADETKNDAIGKYHRLLQDYMQRRGKDIVFQNKHTITLL